MISFEELKKFYYRVCQNQPQQVFRYNVWAASPEAFRKSARQIARKDNGLDSN